MISMDKQYRTRDGRKARVICVDRKGEWPVLALVEDSTGREDCYAYSAHGRINRSGDSQTDLIEVQPVQTTYVRLYMNNAAIIGVSEYASKEPTAARQTHWLRIDKDPNTGEVTAEVEKV